MLIIVFGIICIGGIVLAIALRDALCLLGGLITALIGAIFTGLLIDLPVNAIQRDKINETYNLAALNDGKSTEGSFFLGSGTVDSVPSFMFYAKDGDGYVLRSWDAASSRVVETEGAPRVVYTCDDYSSVPAPFKWAAYMILEDYVDCEHASVTFYVPPGSVKQQYTLDAE